MHEISEPKPTLVTARIMAERWNLVQQPTADSLNE